MDGWMDGYKDKEKREMTFSEMKKEKKEIKQTNE